MSSSDVLERLIAEYGNTPVCAGSKKHLLFDPAVSPASSSNDQETVLDARSCSRREFSRMIVVGGAALGGLLYFGDRQKAEAGAWGFIGAAAFAGLIGWAISKVMDWGWYKLTAGDLTFTKSPSPTRSAFHNPLAAPYEVTNNTKHFKSRLLKGYRVEFGLCEYLRTTDANGPELEQIKKEYDDGVYDSVLLPKTQRMPIRDKDKPTVKKIARPYGLLDGDYAYEYIDARVDDNGKAHLGAGVTIGKKAKYLIA